MFSKREFVKLCNQAYTTCCVVHGRVTGCAVCRKEHVPTCRRLLYMSARPSALPVAMRSIFLESSAKPMRTSPIYDTPQILAYRSCRWVHGHSVCMGMDTFIRSWHTHLGMQIRHMMQGHSVCMGMGTCIRSRHTDPADECTNSACAWTHPSDLRLQISAYKSCRWTYGH